MEIEGKDKISNLVDANGSGVQKLAEDDELQHPLINQ